MILSEHEICQRLSAVVGSAIENTALWRSLLGAAGGPPFHSFEEFARRVPYVDKRILFNKSREQVADGLQRGDLSRIAHTIPSSGTSDDALGMSFLSQEDLASLTQVMDSHLDRTFGVGDRSTLILSALPGGVSVPTSKARSVYIGTRPDLGHRMLQRLAAQHAQTVIVAEPLYAKRLLEYLHRRVYPLRERRIHLILGGYYLPENLRDYLAWLLGVRLDPDRHDGQQILSTFGMGEVGLHLLMETPRTIALRRYLRDRPRLVARLCGVDLPTAPMLMTWDPERVYVEAENQRLVFTMLDPGRLQPVIRYDSRDWGGFVPNHRLREELPRDHLDLVPEDGSDLLWMYGRYSASFGAAAYVTAPRILEGLFAPARGLLGSEDLPPGSGNGGEANSKQGIEDELVLDGSNTRYLASLTGLFRYRAPQNLLSELPSKAQGTLLVQTARRLDGEIRRPRRHRGALQLLPLEEEDLTGRIEENLTETFGTLDGHDDPEEGPRQSFPAAMKLELKEFGAWDAVPLEQLYERKPRFLESDVVIRRALTARDKRRIYQLRHHVFVVEEGLPYGELGADQTRRVVTDEADVNAIHFLAEEGGRVVGALRLVVDYSDFEDRDAFDMAHWVLTGEQDDRWFSERDLRGGLEYRTVVPLGERPRDAEVRALQKVPLGGAGGKTTVGSPGNASRKKVASASVPQSLRPALTTGSATPVDGPDVSSPPRREAGPGDDDFERTRTYDAEGARKHALAKYGLVLSRRAIAQVGRVAVLRSHRRGSRVGERLIARAVDYMLRNGIAAVFLDCSSHHVQRYQSMGFIEYRQPYMHRRTGARYHTLIAFLGTMGSRRRSLWERVKGQVPAVWSRLQDELLQSPGDLSTGEAVQEFGRSMAWAAALFQCSRDSKLFPLNPDWEPPRGKRPQLTAVANLMEALAEDTGGLRELVLAPEFEVSWSDNLAFVEQASGVSGRLGKLDRSEFLRRGLGNMLAAEREAAGEAASDHGLLVWSLLAAGLHPMLGLAESEDDPARRRDLLEQILNQVRPAADGPRVIGADWLKLSQEQRDQSPFCPAEPLQNLWTRLSDALEAVAAGLKEGPLREPECKTWAQHAARLDHRAASKLIPSLIDNLQRDLRAGPSAGAANALLNWAALAKVHATVLGSHPEPGRLGALMKERDKAEELILARAPNSTRTPMVGNPLADALERYAAGEDVPGRSGRPGVPIPTRPSLQRTPVADPAEALGAAKKDEVVRLESDRVFVVSGGGFKYTHPKDADRQPSDNAVPRTSQATVGDTLGVLSAITGASLRFRLAEDLPAKLKLHSVERGPFLKVLGHDARSCLALTRQLVRDYRQRLDPEHPRGSRVRFEFDAKHLARARSGLDSDVFEYLVEGVEPRWRVHGSVVCERGDFSDAVWLVRWGKLFLYRARPAPPPADIDWSLSSLPKAVEVLGPNQIAGFWGALLPLDDSAVGSDLDENLQASLVRRDKAVRARDWLYDDVWLRGHADRDRGRKPQPQRYDVTGIVGPGNALVYELDREEFIHRLENRPAAMFGVCQEVARGIVLHGWREQNEIDAPKP